MLGPSRMGEKLLYDWQIGKERVNGEHDVVQGLVVVVCIPPPEAKVDSTCEHAAIGVPLALKVQDGALA